MEATCSSETLVDFQPTTRRHVPEDSTVHVTILINKRSDLRDSHTERSDDYYFEVTVTLEEYCTCNTIFILLRDMVCDYRRGLD
jgi:hypothetical protein